MPVTTVPAASTPVTTPAVMTPVLMRDRSCVAAGAAAEPGATIAAGAAESGRTTGCGAVGSKSGTTTLTVLPSYCTMTCACQRCRPGAVAEIRCGPESAGNGSFHCA